jgi:transcriptional regulator with PAS, ATPase and Fis domain
MTEEDVATRVLPPELSGAARAVELCVADGPDRGARLRVGGSVARIGTGTASHLRLRDPTVSRIHCEVQPLASGVRITDAASTNGTFLHQARIRDVELTATARIRMGSTSVDVIFGEQGVPVPISARDHLGHLVGASVEMRRIYALIERAAPTEATVLIQGETGTGKEVAARTVHALSPRKAGEFVAVDCGAIATSLIESELFGHVRGAFSGAVSDRAGLFEQADGGTIFLDEVGELPIGLQAKLLRVLELREVRRVGANVSKRVNVRVVAATNRPLARAVNDGSFREDLYYRLAVVEVRMPPLRSRPEDVTPLAQHFYEHFTGQQAPIPADLSSALVTRSWPGNVRELRNFIERSVSIGWFDEGAPPDPARVAALPAGLLALIPTELPLKEARQLWSDRFEVLYTRALLAKTQGNVTRAAERAGVNRRHLQRMLARLGVRYDGEESDD